MTRASLILMATFALLVPSSTPAADDATSLAKSLASGNADEQVKAALALAELGPRAKAAAPALIKALAAEDTQVRGHAAYALGQIGDKSAAVVDGLFAAAGDREAIVRRAALRALKSLRIPRDVLIPKMAEALKQAAPADAAAIVATIAEGGKEAVPFLIDCLDDKRASYWACLALGQIGSDAAPAVAPLAKQCDREEPQVRLQALVALGQIGPAAKPAVPRIVKVLEQDKAEGVRYAAAYALGQIGASDRSSRAALVKGMAANDAFLQVVSAWALARVAKDDKPLQEQITLLILGALTSEKVDVRRAAARALAEIKPSPEAVAPFLVKAVQDEDESVIGNAVDALASLGVAIVPRLTKNGLKNKDLRLYAVRVLGKIGPDAKEAAGPLAETLDGAEGQFRREAQFVLGMFGAAAAPAVPELTKSLASDDEQIRNSAIYALGKIGPAAKPSATELRKLIAGDDEFTRFAALWALVRIEPKNIKLAAVAVPVLVKGLSDERPLVRAESAATLGELGSAAKAALPALKKAAADEEAAVSAAAKEAIEKIGGATN